MSKRTSIGIVLITLAVTVAVSVWLLNPRKEPIYQGKSVTEWMLQQLVTYPHRNETAVEALRQMGEPAVQHLTWMLEHEDSALKLKLISLGERLPWINEILTSSYWYRIFAAQTLGQLGTNASSAIPALERMARSDDMHLSRTAVAALVLIRNEPIGPYILAYQDHTSTTNRAHAIGILMTLGPAAKEAVPILLADLQSTNGRVRLTAVIILRQVGSESAECVAPLIAAFDDENSTVRSSAVSALANFGELARPAIPAVVPKLGDTNASMRSSALMFILEAVPPEEFEALRPLVERATHDPDPAVAGLANALLEYKQGRHR